MTSNKQNNDVTQICALMLDPYDVSPGQRFRIEQWEPFLKKENITVDYFSFTDDKLREVIYKEGHLAAKIKELLKANLRRVGHTLKAKNYDAVFLYRAASMLGPAWIEKFLRWRKIPIIFDFDDAIFLPDTSKANKKFAWAKFSGSKTADICRLSTSVTVGNSYLADYAKKYNEQVFVVPTSIDTEKYQPIAKKDSGASRVVVGWTGSSTSQYHLEEFEPVLVELLKERDVEIRVVSNREPSFTKVPYIWRSWSAETEVEEIAQIDIGIMPTPDDEWSRGKCALKALQYMALGIPAICTDMGANRDVVKHGENGFLAKSNEEWLTAFKTLIDDASLRRKLGDEARKTVVENYSMERCAELFSDAVKATLQNKNNKKVLSANV
jgi:glycosyltransferase involved in cell wall biosynthesis